MTVYVPSSQVPPDLRFAAAPALASPGRKRIHLTADTVLWAKSALPCTYLVPTYLLYADRDALLVASGIDNVAEFIQLLSSTLSTSSL